MAARRVEELLFYGDELRIERFDGDVRFLYAPPPLPPVEDRARAIARALDVSTVVESRLAALSKPEFERLLRLDGEVIRYLLVLNEGEPTTGHSIVAEVPPHAQGRERDPDGEDEDEDEADEDDPTQQPPEFQGARGRRRRMDGPRITLLNFKDVSTLSRFVTEQGKILPKRTTKVNAAFQRQLGRAVKRARYLALLPYVPSHDR